MSYDEHLISMAGGDGEPGALDLDAIQARADKATEGPWEAGTLGGHAADVFTVESDDDLGRLVICEHAGTDADFIAAARTDVPALLALVREQQAQIERVRALCSEWDAVVDVFPLTPAALFAGSHAKRVRAALTATEAGE